MPRGPTNDGTSADKAAGHGEKQSENASGLLTETEGGGGTGRGEQMSKERRIQKTGDAETSGVAGSNAASGASKAGTVPARGNSAFSRSIFSRKLKKLNLQDEKKAITMVKADNGTETPIPVSAPLASTDLRVHLTATMEHRATIAAAAQAALKGYAYDRIVGDGDKETAVPYLYRKFNDRPIQADGVGKLVESFNRQGLLTWDHPIPLCVNGRHIDFTTLASNTLDPKAIPVVEWTEYAKSKESPPPIAASGQHRRAAVKAITRALWARVLQKQAEVAKREKRKDNDALRLARTELAVLEQEYVSKTVWTIAIYDTDTIDADPNATEIYQYLSRNEDLYQIVATDRELWKTRLSELGSTLRRLGVDLEKHMKSRQWLADLEGISGANAKTRDGLGPIMVVPEYVSLLLGLTEYGQHFVEWPHFDPKWWREVLIGTYGMMFTELVDICEMPWRALLNPGDHAFDDDSNQTRRETLNAPEPDGEDYDAVMSLLIDVCNQSRYLPGERREDGDGEEPLAIHDFGIVHYGLYDDLAEAYKTYFRPHALELLTATEVGQDVEE
ncbi:hypothetical protein BV25DRAFT_1922689, partial [Artomyces pyxidatus]